MSKTLLVAFGGMLGSVLRYWATGLVHRLYGGTFPVGTLTVNTLGCFAIGAVLALLEDRQVLSPEVRVFLAVGILGGFTTFSAFGYETLELMRRGAAFFALVNVACNVGLGFVAVWLGVRFGRAL
jgi:CrcB protein